ncbi:MAG TPA: hypothetical protein VGC36_16800 [Rhizomicrobium sp.]
MAISKFAIACVAAVLAGGATAGLAVDGAPVPPAQMSASGAVTPISAIADPNRSFKAVSVQLTSGKTVGRVVAIATDAAGRATRVRVELADMPSQRIWLDQNDLVYSRSRDVIVAHDVHAPAMTMAAAR